MVKKGYGCSFLSRGIIEKDLEDGKDKANIRKVLRLMEGIEDRRAYFITFAVVYMDEAGLWSQGR